jgi:hypothetical protein
MPAGFDAAFALVTELVANFRADKKFHLSPARRCDGQCDALPRMLSGLSGELRVPIK